MKKIWVHKADSFKEASSFDRAYYMRMSKTERLSTVQFLREIYLKFKAPENENGKRLRRVIKVLNMKNAKECS